MTAPSTPARRHRGPGRLADLALVIERLYRIRYLHRGTHPVRSAEQLCRLVWLGLSRSLSLDSS